MELPSMVTELVCVDSRLHSEFAKRDTVTPSGQGSPVQRRCKWDDEFEGLETFLFV